MSKRTQVYIYIYYMRTPTHLWRLESEQPLLAEGAEVSALGVHSCAGLWSIWLSEAETALHTPGPWTSEYGDADLPRFLV